MVDVIILVIMKRQDVMFNDEGQLIVIYYKIKEKIL